MNFHSKKASETQEYEEYWKLTVEYTDINGSRFINTLKIIVDFIDKHPELKKEYSSDLYQELTDTLHGIYKKADKGSTRKSINQFVKLGFITPGLKSYPDETRSFLKATSAKERELFFSEIYYKYASFNSSVTNNNTHIKQINFFLKTLMHQPEQKLNEDEITGLMSTDITLHRNGYLNSSELASAVAISQAIGFEERKYNQIKYFWTFLRHIPGVYIKPDKTEVSYIEDDTLDVSDVIDTKRDMTLYRIMREKVKEESIEIYGDVVCYLTKKPQKGLVVSHIWPSSEALKKGDIYSAYNPNNALLLEPNIDAYFDKFDITFNKDSGIPKYSSIVYDDFISDHEGMVIEERLLNKERVDYLDVHNQYFTEKKSL